MTTTSKEWNSLPEYQREILARFQEEFPIKVGSVAKELGVTVKISTLPAGISGEIREIDGAIVIKVNRHDSKERQRFTIAHEISHFLLHKDKIGDGIIDDVLYRSCLTDELEAQANRLAADIVMPWTLIKRSLDRINAEKLEQKIEIIANEAEVSVIAMKIRFGKL